MLIVCFSVSSLAWVSVCVSFVRVPSWHVSARASALMASFYGVWFFSLPGVGERGRGASWVGGGGGFTLRWSQEVDKYNENEVGHDHMHTFVLIGLIVNLTLSSCAEKLS